MKWYWMLAAFAFVVLGSAAVGLGGLNQDEGWYLYAANLVSEGEMPYRDFFFTQGPLLPAVYSAFTGIWRNGGLLGARVFNLAIGALGIAFACGMAARLAKGAALVTFFLLATNLYHLYNLAIPKTYALAGLFVLAGFYLLTFVGRANARSAVLKGYGCACGAGLCLAFAAGTRISLGAILPVVGLALVVSDVRDRERPLAMRLSWLAFGVGGLFGLALAYGPVLADGGARAGLVAAQQYHAARGGSDVVWTVGSLIRLVRWYLPVFVVLGLGVAAGLKPRDCEMPAGGGKVPRVAFLSFLAVFVVQMLAPFPYEDYQVPIMGLLAVVAAVGFAKGGEVSQRYGMLLVLGLCFATSFGSPLLQEWMTNGQDRFWSLKKETSELAQLRDVARRIEALDPGGKTLLTQDLYLAIETNRKVPKGLEMGPFAMLTDADWRALLASVHETCPVAALSGYTFAIEPPACSERPLETQLDYWNILERHYAPMFREANFGQNATPLLVLRVKGTEEVAR